MISTVSGGPSGYGQPAGGGASARQSDRGATHPSAWRREAHQTVLTAQHYTGILFDTTHFIFNELPTSVLLANRD